MKRLLCGILAALLLCGACCAEDMPARVGETAGEDGIYRYTAENGQEIYFVARETFAPQYIDVNFDGINDIVVVTAVGASNFYSEFFIKVGDQYVMAQHPFEEYGLCNYMLYPEKGLILSSQSNGYAGALFERCLYRFDGAEMKLVRRMVSEEYTTVAYDGALYTEITDGSRLRVRLTEYTTDMYEGTLLSDEIIALDDLTAERFNALESALFAGL